jgi:hypothetical protein
MKGGRASRAAVAKGMREIGAAVGLFIILSAGEISDQGASALDLPLAGWVAASSAVALGGEGHTWVEVGEGFSFSVWVDRGEDDCWETGTAVVVVLLLIKGGC